MTGVLVIGSVDPDTKDRISEATLYSHLGSVYSLAVADHPSISMVCNKHLKDTDRGKPLSEEDQQKWWRELDDIFREMPKELERIPNAKWSGEA